MFLSQIDALSEFFTGLGYKVEEIVLPQRSVGLFDGYVLLEHKNRYTQQDCLYELCLDTAQMLLHEWQNLDFKDLVDKTKYIHACIKCQMGYSDLNFEDKGTRLEVSKHDSLIYGKYIEFTGKYKSHNFGMGSWAYVYEFSTPDAIFHALAPTKFFTLSQLEYYIKLDV